MLYLRFIEKKRTTTTIVRYCVVAYGLAEVGCPVVYVENFRCQFVSSFALQHD